MLETKNILLIDDNQIDLFLTQTFLKKFAGAKNIYTASSGVDALRILQDNSIEFPDIIFLDIKMPAMDGFEFLEEFQKINDARKSSCEIFMLSSSQDPTDVQKSLQNPFVKNFLNKPISQKVINHIFN
jgi:CheY-like chemotaxis protein